MRGKPAAADLQPRTSHAAAAPAVAAASPAAASTAAGTPRKPGLSKHVEYPGDESEVARLLAGGTVDPAGRDAFGLTALPKYVLAARQGSRTGGAACNMAS